MTLVPTLKTSILKIKNKTNNELSHLSACARIWNLDGQEFQYESLITICPVSPSPHAIQDPCLLLPMGLLLSITPIIS